MNGTRHDPNVTLVATIFIVASIVLMLVLAIGLGVLRVLSLRPPPQPTLLVTSGEAYPGGAMQLAGSNWPADQLVFVYLADPERPGEPEVIFSGVADAQGQFRLDVPYPLDPRWSIPQVEVLVVSRDETARQAAQASVATLTPTPTPTLTPTPTETSIASTPTLTFTPTPAITDWRGEYFNNPSLSGNPVLVRNDSGLSFDWGNLSPDPALPVDGFSVKWTRPAQFQTGTYRFKLAVDDGARVYVDNTLVIDEWRVGSLRTVSRDAPLSAGSHSLRVEMFEQTGQATLSFSYEQVVTFDDWKGEYFSNRDLSGSPTVTRNDKVIHFDWGDGAPAPSLPADRFSARWTRMLNFPVGSTKFIVRADDGVRLSVDNSRLIDKWQDASGQTYEAEIDLTGGLHSVTLEYYENTGQANVGLVYYLSALPDWKGEYFANADLSGLPVLVRNDPQLDFTWGDGSPADVIPADGFSARWTRRVNLEAGTYRFALIHDDGARLFIDGLKLIDEWRDSSTTTHTASIPLSGGPVEIVVEFYERTGQARASLSWARQAETVTPSPTPTVTLTPSPSQTATPSATASPTLTPSPSPSWTPSPTTTPQAY